MDKNFKESIFNNILNDYCNSDEYKREVAMNLFNGFECIPILDEYSDVYDAGIRYIKEIHDGFPYVYDIYVDVIFLFSEFYRKWCSYFRKITVISNEFNLSTRNICYSNSLYFDIDMSGFTYILGQNIKLTREDILSLMNSNINLKFNTDKIIVYLSFWNLDESIIPDDIKMFNYLISFIPNYKYSIVFIDIILNLSKGDIQYYTSRLLKGLFLNKKVRLNFTRNLRNHSKPKFGRNV